MIVIGSLLASYDTCSTLRRREGGAEAADQPDVLI